MLQKVNYLSNESHIFYNVCSVILGTYHVNHTEALV